MLNLHDSRIVIIERIGNIVDGLVSRQRLMLGESGVKRAKTSITNETNLTGGENVGGTGTDAVSVSADDDGDGDGDPDPDRRKSRKTKPHEASEIVEPTERRIEPEHTSDKAGRDQQRWRVITTSNLRAKVTPTERAVSNRQNRTRTNMTDLASATTNAVPATPSASLTLPPEGYARLPQVLAAIPVSKSSWWAGVRAGKYPQSVKLGPRTTVWKVSDIRALIAAA